jgi:hypothetical protein
MGTGPASAAPWGWHRGWGVGGLAAGIVGGAIAAATSPLWAPGYYGYAYGWGPAYRVYDYVPALPVVVGGGGSVPWCEAHFRSYNPATGMYLATTACIIIAHEMNQNGAGLRRDWRSLPDASL